MNIEGLRNRVLPQRNPKWWTPDRYTNFPQNIQEFESALEFASTDEANRSLEQAREVALTAKDRAEAADKRATTIAGSVSIAASFTLSGGALALDSTKLDNQLLRVLFAAVLLLSVLAFVLSASYSLRALVRFRIWSRPDPAKFWHQRDSDLQAELTKRMAWLLRDFAYNWEVSDVKNRNVDPRHRPGRYPELGPDPVLPMTFSFPHGQHRRFHLRGHTGRTVVRA